MVGVALLVLYAVAVLATLSEYDARRLGVWLLDHRFEWLAGAWARFWRAL